MEDKINCKGTYNDNTVKKNTETQNFKQNKNIKYNEGKIQKEIKVAKNITVKDVVRYMVRVVALHNMVRNVMYVAV